MLDGVEQLAVIEDVGRLAAETELLAQRRHARVLGAGPDHGAVGDAIVRLGAGARLARRPGELVLELLECRFLRIEAVEGGVDVARRGNLLQHVGRIRRVIAVIDLRKHPQRRDAAALQMAGEGEHILGEREVGVGKLLGAVGGGKIRHR